MPTESQIKLEAPELITVDTTVKEIYEALKKNGFEHIRESWQDGNGGCVLQQTAWNLDVVATHDNWSEVDDYYDIPYPGYDESNYEEINSKVEEKWAEYALDKQLNELGITPTDSKWYDSVWGSGATVGLGATIIHWNDKRKWNKNKEEYEYALPTYADVAKMAYDVLSPHFDKTVKLLKYEYPNKPAKIND